MGGIVIAAAAAAVVNLLGNGSFDAGSPDAGWSIPGDGYWRIEEKSGVGGSSALVWDSSEQCPKSLCSYTIPAEPGCIYSVSCRVNVEAIKTGEWSVGMDWSTADGKWIDATGMAKTVDNHPSVAQGWIRYEGGTPPLPAEAAVLRVYAYVKTGASGRIRFDDFSVENVGSRAVEYLVSSAYHDCATAGEVRFFAKLNINPVRHDPAKIAAQFRYIGADGRPTVKKSALKTSFGAGTKIAVKDMAMGKSKVEFLLVDAAGAVIGSDELEFTRTAEPVRRKVYIDDRQFAVVDGKRFFPIGMYSRIMTDEQFDFFTRGPFNCVKMANHGVKKEYLDAFWKRGIRVIVDIRDEIKVITADKSESKAAGLKAVADTVLAWKDHPAVLGWYNNDEAPLSLIPDIRLATRLVYQLDPDHPTYAVTDKPGQAQSFMPTYDVIGMDPYPVGNLGGNNKIGIASRWPETCRRETFGMKAMWQVPQMFNWEWYSNGVAKEKLPDTRLPTRDEFASMCWQAVAGGANGLVGYSFLDFWKRQEPADRDRNWKYFCEVLEEIRRMEPVLLSDPSPLRFGGVPDDMAVRTWRKGGEDWFLAANRTESPVSAKLVPGGRCGGVSAELGGSASLLPDGRIGIELRPLGYAMVRIR